MLRRYILLLKKSPIITALLAIVYIMVCIKNNIGACRPYKKFKSLRFLKG